MDDCAPLGTLRHAIFLGHGVFAHRIKHIYYKKWILNVFKKSKNGRKLLGVHLNILCSPTKFCGGNFFVSCVKRQKNVT
jgi:hypothetical protein